MIIKCHSFAEMADDIKKNNKSIIMFGSGTIGTTTTIGILTNYELCDYIDCYVDNDARLWGKEIETVHGEYEVKAPKYIEQCVSGQTVILLNISRCFEVIEQLQQMVCTENMVCYIMPMMCIHNFKPDGNRGVSKKYAEPVIPKVIHYMWLGGNKLPDNLQKCIDSWKKFCPDYEIICWDESNYDIGKNLYMKQAYENKAYGFVPDYARLDILYHYGGIYMDTDVELKRNLDDLLYQDGFCGVEKWQVINPGGCMGAVRHQEFIKKIIEDREKTRFINADGSFNRNASGFYDTATALKHGYNINGKNQEILGMTIYTSDYFHPYDYMSGKCEVTNDTFSIHHFNGGWLNEEQQLANKRVTMKYDELYKLASNIK